MAASLAVLLLGLSVFAETDDRLVEVVVRAPKSEAQWVAERFADACSEHLLQLGVLVRDRRWFGPADKIDGSKLKELGLSAAVWGSLETKKPDDPSSSVTVRLNAEIAGKKREKIELKGVINDLDALAGKAAIELGKLLNVEPKPALVKNTQAFSVQKMLGEAEVDLKQKEYRRAILKFDRAQELSKPTICFESMDGAYRAKRAAQIELDSHAELAASALERAEVSSRQGKDKAAFESFQSFLKFSSDKALRFSFEARLGDEEQKLIHAGDRWLARGKNAKGARLFSIDSASGMLVDDESPVRGLVHQIGRHRLILDGRKLYRKTERGDVQWETALPFTPVLFEGRRLHVVGGYALVVGETGLVFVDVGLGTIEAKALGNQPLAIGPEGVAVATVKDGRPVLALLRPGRDAPAFFGPLSAPPWLVKVSKGRVSIIENERLRILDGQTGEERAGPFTLGDDARFLGVSGRYGAIQIGDAKIHLYDVLSGEKTAEIQGPGRAIASISFDFGIAIAFSSGDVLSFDRDGKLLDRAWVKGRVLDFVPSGADAPGMAVMTTRGLFVFGEPPVSGKMRDLDAVVKMLGLLEKRGESDAALVLASQAAARGFGRTRELEELRAKILSKMPGEPAKSAAAFAQKRAALAKDPKLALTPFRWFE